MEAGKKWLDYKRTLGDLRENILHLNCIRCYYPDWYDIRQFFKMLLLREPGWKVHGSSVLFLTTVWIYSYFKIKFTASKKKKLTLNIFLKGDSHTCVWEIKLKLVKQDKFSG